MGVQRRYKWDQKGTWIYKSTKGIQGMGLDGICKRAREWLIWKFKENINEKTV